MLSVLGILLSITNEWSHLPWETPGWALLTRSLHIWLGVGALFGVLFNFRPGIWMLFLWIISSFPVIALDPSGTWTAPILEANATTESWSLTNEGLTREYNDNYTKKGINFAPIAVSIWFIIAMRLKAFPLLQLARHHQFRMRVASTVVLGGWLGGIVAYTCYLLTAPFLIWGNTAGQAFYYKDEQIGTQFLRIDQALIERIGLDATQPKSDWQVVQSHDAPFGLGIHISDGIAAARIDVHNAEHDSKQINIQTPWGERTGTLIREDRSDNRAINQLRPSIYVVHPIINKDFQVKVAPEPTTTSPGASMTLMTTITPLGQRPQFAQAKLRVCFVDLNTNTPDKKKYSIFNESFETPEGILELSEGPVQISLTVTAPKRPGSYSVYIQSIWLYDESGDYAEPIRKIQRSSYQLVEVINEDSRLARVSL